MGFTCGIVGLPNVGKSTLFNSLTSAGAQAENYPFCTIEPNRGVVAVEDRRLDELARLVKPEKATPTSLELLDIAGLVKGASKGEGLGNQFLSHIRGVDVVAQVVRCFEDENVVHVDGGIDPVRDLEIVTTELLLKDLESLERRADKLLKLAKVGDKEARSHQPCVQRAIDAVQAGTGIRDLLLAGEGDGCLDELSLLTARPVMVVANVSDEQLTARDDPAVAALEERAAALGAPLVRVSARTEAELNDLAEDERGEFLEALGLEETSLTRVVRTGYDLLGLVTFFTAVGTECRAWTVPAGTPAVKAAGRIHTDMERGFIKAEVIPFERLMEHGSETAAREAGAIAIEGRDAVIKDGDVVRFRFNV